MTPFALISLIVIGTTIWVGIDASNLGMSRGRAGGGFLDMGPAGWVFACLLFWIVAFPCYLAARANYRNAPVAFAYGTPPVQPLYSPPPPPQVSPDGRWWWDGRQWLPMLQGAPGGHAPTGF